MREYRLGIIGLSEGNGHPYSWSALFNGFEREVMDKCGFPVIPQYLSEHQFPDDFISGARVTHVWTQSEALSKHIASASYIDHVLDDPQEMIGQVDGVLLARDDAQNHLFFARPFLEAGLPVYIDKPLALNRSSAEAIFNLEQYSGQIFSCSALRFSEELILTPDEYHSLGDVHHVVGRVPNCWDKYIVHAIDPILETIGCQGGIVKSNCFAHEDRVAINLCWESGVTCTLLAMGALNSGIEIEFIGTKAREKRLFTDSFSAFKNALLHFVEDSLKQKISHKKRILETVDVIERGSLER